MKDSGVKGTTSAVVPFLFEKGMYTMHMFFLQTSPTPTVAFASGFDWTMAGAVATWIYVVLFGLTILYIHKQLNEMKMTGEETKKARQTEAALRVLEYIHETETRHSRWIVFHQADELRNIFNRVAETNSWRNIGGEVYQNLKDDEGNAIEFREVELSLKILDNVACLITEGYAPYNILVDGLLKNEFIRWWLTFGPYIIHRRNQPKGSPQVPEELNKAWNDMVYCRHLEKLIAEIAGKRGQPYKPLPYVPELSHKLPHA